MNLWAKRAGLLLSAAVLIFLISCEDDSYLLGFKGNKKFDGRYQEIVFDGEKSSVILLGSVYTDQYALSSEPVQELTYQFMLGQYTDPTFGNVRAEAFMQFLPKNSPFIPPYFNRDDESLFLDSVSVRLLFNYYAYGPQGDMSEKFTVHQLTDSLSFFNRYFNNSTLAYNPIPLKELSFNLQQIIYNLHNDAGRDSSFYLRGILGKRGDDESAPGWVFAKNLFAYMTSGDSSILVGNKIQEFKKQFMGLAIIPSSANPKRILGFNPISTNSQLIMHYHNNDNDTLSFSFFFDPFPYSSANGFNNITTTRTGALSGLTVPNTRYYPNNDPASTERYLQDGSTVITELDLSDYYSFIDTLEDVIINSAEISLSVAEPPSGMNPPTNLYAMLMKETGHGKIGPLSMNVNADSLIWRNVVSDLYTEGTNFVLSTEGNSQAPLVLTYNSSTKRYSGYATLFFQTLFNNKEKPEYNIKHLGIYPASAPVYTTVAGRSGTYPVLQSGIGNEVNRVVFKTNGLKLKIYYTVPNKSNLE